MIKTFFISGVQRSGTTLLSFLLSNHSEVLLGSRAMTYRILTLVKSYRENLSEQIQADRNQLLRKLIQQDKTELLAEWLDHENLATYESLRALVEGSIQQQLQKANKSVWGDKAPNLQHYLEHLFYLLPHTKVIHIIRDGRAVASSMQNRTEKSLRLSAQEWVNGNVEALAAIQILGKEQFLIIRYEDLVTNTADVLQKVCQFIGLNFEVKMLDLSQHDLTNSDNAYVNQRIDASKLNQYQQVLNSAQIDQIERIQAPLLQQLNYDLIGTYAPKELRQLTVLQQVWLRQRHNFAALFRSKATRLVNWESVEVKVPLQKRLGFFLQVLAQDVFSEAIFKSLLKQKEKRRK